MGILSRKKLVKNMKLIKGIFSGLLLIFMMTVLVGCNKLGVIQEYKYDDSNYIAGNKAFSSVMNKINIDWIVGNIFITQSNNHEVIIREETDIDHIAVHGLDDFGGLLVIPGNYGLGQFTHEAGAVLDIAQRSCPSLSSRFQQARWVRMLGSFPQIRRHEL